MQIVVIHPENGMSIETIPDSQDGAYRAIKGFVGGDLELLSLLPDMDGYIDENAKVRQDRPPVLNDLATRLVFALLQQTGRVLLPGDYIAGTLVLVGNRNRRGKVDGNLHTLPPVLIDRLTTFVRGVAPSQRPWGS